MDWNPPLNPFRRLLPVGAILLTILGVGIAGFMAIEHWTLLEFLYMVNTTLLTIGFQEIHPLPQQGRVCTIVLAVLG